MPFRAGFKLRPLFPAQETAGPSGYPAEAETETAHRLLRFVLWLLRAPSTAPTALPVRVFYRFESGSWRTRNTHQLEKVYRCR